MPPARHVFLFALGWLGLASAFAGSPPPTLVSDAPGFLFVEGEPVNVALEQKGPCREGVYQFEVRDTETDWRAHGEGKLPKLREGESRQVAFTLPLPERGLYRLRVSGKSGQSFSLEKNLALTFAPRPTDPQSPWGIFYVPPVWFAPNDPAGPERAAASIRRLGASWVRLNFWAPALEPVTISAAPSGTVLTPDLKRWKSYAAALHREGLRIMGEISQTPRVLSSDPSHEETLGDGGPAYNRTKPADYALWEQLMEKVAREFREEIDVWEVWNEPDNQGVYWRGSPDELVDLVRHTGAGLRRGNPASRIVGCGFTSTPAGRFFAEAALRAGLAKELDVFSFHYSDLHTSEVERWRELLKNFRPELPLWNTEERSLVPIFDRAQGVERSCKFLHVAIGYEETEPLVDKDYSARPAALAFATGAHILGSAKYLRTDLVAGGSLHIFSQAGATIGVYQAEPLARFLATSKVATEVMVLKAEGETGPLLVTNLRGKTRELRRVRQEGKVSLVTTESMLFLQGWKTLAAEPISPERFGRFEAENGHFGSGWRRVLARDASGQALLEANRNAPAGSSTELRLDLQVADDGDYELLLAAQAVPEGGNSDTGFTWSVDDAPPQTVAKLPEPLPGGEAAGVRLLGHVHLAPGPHPLRLTSTSPAPAPTALRLDAVALRPTANKARVLPTKKG